MDDLKSTSSKLFEGRKSNRKTKSERINRKYFATILCKELMIKEVPILKDDFKWSSTLRGKGDGDGG